MESGSWADTREKKIRKIATSSNRIGKMDLRITVLLIVRNLKNETYSERHIYYATRLIGLGNIFL
jgi:hypothetical protein